MRNFTSQTGEKKGFIKTIHSTYTVLFIPTLSNMKLIINKSSFKRVFV